MEAIKKTNKIHPSLVNVSKISIYSLYISVDIYTVFELYNTDEGGTKRSLTDTKMKNLKKIPSVLIECLQNIDISLIYFNRYIHCI